MRWLSWTARRPSTCRTPGYSRRSKFGSSKSTPPKLIPVEETETTRAFPARFKAGQSRAVNWKCPKWFVANWDS
jgi:hypothetical protein